MHLLLARWVGILADGYRTDFHPDFVLVAVANSCIDCIRLEEVVDRCLTVGSESLQQTDSLHTAAAHEQEVSSSAAEYYKIVIQVSEQAHNSAVGHMFLQL